MRSRKGDRIWAAGWFALACVLMIVILNGKPDFSSASEPARGIASPVIALQMARSVAEVDDVLGDAPGPDREAMRIKQYLDFAFIAAYAGLYISLAAIFRTRLAMAAAGCGVLAAVFDVIENVAVLRIVDVPLHQTTQPMIDAIRDPSLAKWTLAFVAAALFAIVFLRSRTAGMRVTGACEATAAALGFYGIYDNAFLVWAGIPMLAGLIGMVVLFVGSPLASGRVVSKDCVGPEK